MQRRIYDILQNIMCAEGYLSKDLSVSDTWSPEHIRVWGVFTREHLNKPDLDVPTNVASLVEHLSGVKSWDDSMAIYVAGEAEGQFILTPKPAEDPVIVSESVSIAPPTGEWKMETGDIEPFVETKEEAPEPEALTEEVKEATAEEVKEEPAAEEPAAEAPTEDVKEVPTA